MIEENWQIIYTTNADWYEHFLSKIKIIHD